MKYKKHGRNKERLITKMSAKTFEVNRKKFTSNFLTNRIKSDTIKLIVYLNRLHLFIGKKVAQKGKRFELFFKNAFQNLFLKLYLKKTFHNPAAGSPTATLLRLLIRCLA